MVLGKLDAVELWPQRPDGAQPGHFNFLRFLDWYRYLNCGYRLPAVGGTDKMGAYMPVGANRAYAHIGEEEFNFANWAKAVRSGNTFVTSGPLLVFQADGRQLVAAGIKSERLQDLSPGFAKFDVQLP